MEQRTSSVLFVIMLMAFYFALAPCHADEPAPSTEIELRCERWVLIAEQGGIVVPVPAACQISEHGDPILIGGNGQPEESGTRSAEPTSPILDFLIGLELFGVEASLKVSDQDNVIAPNMSLLE